MINHKSIEENKLECIKNWNDLFSKNIPNSSHINRRLPSDKDPTTRIMNRWKNFNYKIINVEIIFMYKICIYRLKSYDDPIQSPDFVLRLSDVQTIPTSVLYHQNHLLNIIQLNIKQIIEFIKSVFYIIYAIFLTLNFIFL